VLKFFSPNFFLSSEWSKEASRVARNQISKANAAVDSLIGLIKRKFNSPTDVPQDIGVSNHLNLSTINIFIGFLAIFRIEGNFLPIHPGCVVNMKVALEIPSDFPYKSF